MEKVYTDKGGKNMEKEARISRGKIAIYDSLIQKIEEFFALQGYGHVGKKKSDLIRAVSEDCLPSYIRKEKDLKTSYILMESETRLEKGREEIFTMLNALQIFFSKFGCYVQEYYRYDKKRAYLVYMEKDKILPFIEASFSPYLQIFIDFSWLEILTLQNLPSSCHHDHIPLLILDQENPKIQLEKKKLMEEGYISFPGTFEEQIVHFQKEQYLLGRILSNQALKKNSILSFHLVTKEKKECQGKEKKDFEKMEEKYISDLYAHSMKEHLKTIENHFLLRKLCSQCAKKMATKKKIYLPLFQRLDLKPCDVCKKNPAYDFYLSKKE